MKTRIDNLKDLRGSLAALNISGNPALWEKEFLLNPDEAVMAQIEAKDAELAGAEAIMVAYESMVKDVYDEMENVFGTRNDVSAQATASTYEAMLKRPAAYVGMAGLVDEAAVTAYATTKVAEADAYGVFRLNRIAQFQTEKESIFNS